MCNLGLQSFKGTYLATVLQSWFIGVRFFKAEICPGSHSLRGYQWSLKDSGVRVGGRIARGIKKSLNVRNNNVGNIFFGHLRFKWTRIVRCNIGTFVTFANDPHWCVISQPYGPANEEMCVCIVCMRICEGLRFKITLAKWHPAKMVKADARIALCHCCLQKDGIEGVVVSLFVENWLWTEGESLWIAVKDFERVAEGPKQIYTTICFQMQQTQWMNVCINEMSDLFGWFWISYELFGFDTFGYGKKNAGVTTKISSDI